MEVLRSCEQSGPGPEQADSSAELGGRSDMATARSSSFCPLFRAAVEGTWNASSAAILGDGTEGPIADSV